MANSNYPFEIKNLNCEFHPLTGADEPIVWQMLRQAAHEPTLEAVKRQPFLARYAEGWGRHGDAGFVALVRGQAIGAAWLRLWPDSDKGFGYINQETPELALAVLPEFRGNGVGTRLLALLLKATQESYPAVSLNVRADNPVVRLYERAGFVRVEGSESSHRAGGVSFNMVRRTNPLTALEHP